MAATIQDTQKTWTITEQYFVRKAVRAKWETDFSNNIEVIADKIAGNIAADALEKLKEQFQACSPLPIYGRLFLIYPLSLKENIQNEPWLLKVDDIAPFDEIIPLLLKTKKINDINREWPIEDKAAQLKLEKEREKENEYLDHLMDRIGIVVTKYLSDHLTDFAENPGNSSLRHKVSLQARAPLLPPLAAHVSLWIDKTELESLEQ